MIVVVKEKQASTKTDEKYIADVWAPVEVCALYISSKLRKICNIIFGSEMNPSPLFKLSENSSALVGGVDSMEATFSNSCDGGLTNERTKRTKEFLTELIKHNYLGTLLRLWCRVKGGADRICHIGVGDPKVVQPVLHYGHQNWKRFIARIIMRKNTCVAIHIPGFICHTCARDLISIFFLFPFVHFQPILQPHPLQGDRRLLSRKNPKPASVVLPFLCVSLS